MANEKGDGEMTDGGTAESGITDILNGNQETNNTTNNHRTNTNNTTTSTSGETERLGGTNKKWGGRRTFLKAAGTAAGGATVVEAATETSLLGYVANFFLGLGSTGGAAPVTNSSDQNQNQNQGYAIALNGLGAYGGAVRSAGPIDEKVSTGPKGVETTIDDIHNMLEQTSSVDEEREWLAENTPVDHNQLHQVMNTYHRAKAEKQEEEDQAVANQVVANINWSFTGQSSPIAEFYTVENGELQGQPSITYQKGIELLTNHPGENKPEPIANLRDDTNWASMVPQDYDSIQRRIERSIDDDVTEQDVIEYRADILKHFSRAAFGVGAEPNLRPQSVDDANILLESMYGEGAATAYTQFAQSYNPDDFAEDQVVEATYTGSSWEFQTTDKALGARLEGEERRFS